MAVTEIDVALVSMRAAFSEAQNAIAEDFKNKRIEPKEYMASRKALTNDLAALESLYANVTPAEDVSALKDRIKTAAQRAGEASPSP